jgi:4-amino-4-deoxy-L-arabinose transferase-like glycosyltransferase
MSSKYWLIFPLLGLFFRLFWLPQYPAGFTPDEAAFGYNAYSLFKTGRDEWGKSFYELPIVGLRSFGDYKLPLYSFLDVPVITAFGLNEFSVRLPNALLSVITLPVLYVLARRVFRSKPISRIAVILFSVSPWSVPLSRGGFEANLAVFFLTLGLALLVSRRALLSAVIFALGMYSYHTTRLVTPPLFLLSLFFLAPGSKRLKPAIIFLLLSFPAIFSLFRFNARSADVSIFNPSDGWAEMAQKRLSLINSGWNPKLAQLVENKFTTAGKVFIRNYFSYFSLRFLFQNGPGEPTYGMLPGKGVTYATDLILLPLGLLFLARKLKTRAFWPLILLALLSPIPASLTKGAGFAGNRAAPLLIPLILTSAAGMEFLRQKSKTRLVPGLLAVLLFFLSLSYFSYYKKTIPNLSAHAMGYGWSDAVMEIYAQSNNYSEIRISRSLSEPHIYVAFYSLFNPHAYQVASIDWSDFESRGFRFLDQYDGYWLDNFRFGDLNFDKPVNFPVLYVGRPEDFPEGTSLKIISFYPDGKPCIVMAAKTGLDSLSFRL